MTSLRGIGALGILLVVGFAGCTESSTSSDLGFTYSIPDDPRTEAVTFKASVAADRYEWNMGDSVTYLEGQEVSKVYGISDGTVTVRLKAYNGEEVSEYARLLIFGSGENQAPNFGLAFSTEWTTKDEGLILVQTGTDPEGDPLTYQWTCTYEGPVTLKTGDGHVHVPGAGSYQPAPRAYEPTLLTGDIPVPEVELPSDLCMPEQIGRSEHTQETKSLLRFEKAGQYHLHLWSKDVTNPSVSTDFIFLVTDTKPEPTFQQTFAGNLTFGTGGAAQGTVPEETNLELDQRIHRLELEATGLNTTFNLVTTGTEGVDDVTYAILQGGQAKRTDLEPGSTNVGSLTRGNYDIVITYNRGAQVGYVLDVQGEYDLNPRTTYEFHG